MNTKQIDYALELAQVKNFNRAAENLFIFQPSLSYQIQALENEIGLALFLRSGRGAGDAGRRAVLSDAQEYPRGAEGRHRAGGRISARGTGVQ